MITRAGIDASLLLDPENALSFVELGRLLQACVDATGCSHFGLLVGQRSGTSCLGLVGRLMQNAPTLGDAILDLCTNQVRYIQGAVTYLMVSDETAYWGYATYIPGVETVEQIRDGALAVGVNIMRELAGVSPENVVLSRFEPRNVAAFRQCFGVKPTFAAEQHALVFPANLLTRPVPGADSERRRRLEQSVAEYWAVHKPGFSDRVFRILRARVLFVDATPEGVARDLMIWPRTLNRRLQEEGTSFRDLRSRALFDAARTLLAGTGISVTELALALGYADTSAFTHAFRRWAGTSPNQWRQQLRVT